MKYLVEPISLTFPRFAVWMIGFVCLMAAVRGARLVYEQFTVLL